jgi:hypothetical protein
VGLLIFLTIVILIRVALTFSLLDSSDRIISRRALHITWGTALLLTLGMLLLPRYTLFPDHTNPFFLDPFYSIYAFFTRYLSTYAFFIRYLLPQLAWILASLLLSFGLAGGQLQPTAPGGWRAIASLALGAILLLYSFYDLYWLFVWDQTGDAVYQMLLPVSVVAVILAGAPFTIALQGKQKWYGLAFAALLLGAALFTTFSLALRVDYYRLTEARAGQVSQAIERYYARAGHYPATLVQLVPVTRLSLPGPVIIPGQDWCYQSGEGYYRLGYVSRDNWSSPYLYIRTYQQAGVVPEIPALCADETEALIARIRILRVIGE